MANPEIVAERPVPMTEATPSEPDDIECLDRGIPDWPQVDLSYERIEHGQRVIYIGEIKPLDDEGKQVTAGRKQLQDYERAFRASGKYAEVYRMRDSPPPGPLFFFEWPRPPRCPPQIIQVAQTEPGLYQYYCRPPFSELVRDSRCDCRKINEEEEKEEEKQQQKRLNLPLLIGTGALVAGAAITASVVRPKVPTPKPIVRPPVRVVPPRVGGTVTPIRQPKPFTPGRVAAPHHRPSTGGRSRGGVGRVAGGIGIAAGLAFTVYEVYSLLSTFDDAKKQIAALEAYREQFWKELDEELARQKKQAATDVPPTQVVTTPPVQPAKQPDPQPPKPVEKTVKIPVYRLSRALQLTKSEIEVPSSAVGALYQPVSFWTLTPPGKFISAIESSQVDCSKLGAGANVASGWQKLAGYADPFDAARLMAVLGDQLTLVRAMCILSGQVPEPAAQPDGDEVTAVVTMSEGTVTATCKKVGANFSCSKDGDFASLKEATEDQESNEKYQFTLEVSLVRVRGGKSQRFDRSVTAWLENPDHPAPEPHVKTDGSIPRDAVDPGQYPADSALSYILRNYYSTWGGS